jgi:hypothetical protein
MKQLRAPPAIERENRSTAKYCPAEAFEKTGSTHERMNVMNGKGGAGVWLAQSQGEALVLYPESASIWLAVLDQSGSASRYKGSSQTRA